METEKKFNVRVYFLLIDKNAQRILVADEIIREKHYTKFPGGGLEFGEGTRECVEREAMEELGQQVEVSEHFYTTDFFVQSAFRTNDQVISIYYLAKMIGNQQFHSADKKFEFQQLKHDEESFRWVSIYDLDKENFAFPSDRKVVELFLTQKSGF